MSTNATASSSAGSGSAGRAIDIIASEPPPTRTPASTAESSVEPKLSARNSGDSCTWYTGGICYAPRSCSDCINTLVRNDACAVDPNGMCVSMTAYNRFASRPRADRGQVGFNGYFPAANFTYCPVDDAACNACKTEWRNEYFRTNEQPPPAMCRGADGCVCISACEMPDRAERIVMNTCTMFGFDRSKLVTSAYIGAAVFGIMVLLFLVFRRWAKKRMDREHEQAEQDRLELRERRRQRQRDRQMRTGPLLGLGGWNSLRDKLLETDRERSQPSLAGIGVAEREQEGSSRDANSDRLENDDGVRAHENRPDDAVAAPPSAVPTAAERHEAER